MKICQLVLLSILGFRAAVLSADPSGITLDISSSEAMQDWKLLGLASVPAKL